jgi:uncharacterized protein YbaP (TraB family)
MTLSFAFTSLRHLLIFAMLSASLGATAAAQASTPQPTAPQPVAGKGLPMWVNRDDDSTIYITGTIHILKNGTSWRSDRLDAAFASASELGLEVAEIGDPDGIRAAGIEKIFEGSGVAFIAVGAGHLIGPDSLQAQLKKRGIETERY